MTNLGSAGASPALFGALAENLPRSVPRGAWHSGRGRPRSPIRHSSDIRASSFLWESSSAFGITSNNDV